MTTLALLGVNGTPTADFNLLAHITLGLLLLVGLFLARRRWFTAHMLCQGSVLLLNLPLIALIMFPSFRDSVEPQLPGGLSQQYIWVATVHATLGTIAELLGLWIIFVAVLNDIDYRRSRRVQSTTGGTSGVPPASGGFNTARILPRRFRFHRYKLWMRTELTLWWLIVGIGIGVYIVFYRT